jgi:hypothetical protein
MTTRRDFVALAASAAVVWPVTAPAQPGDGMRRLGVLMSLRADDPEGQAYAAALVQGLGALKWHDGDNLRIDWRWALGDPVLVERYATELAASETEVLVAFSSTSVEALQRRTSTIANCLYERNYRPGLLRWRPRTPGSVFSKEAGVERVSGSRRGEVALAIYRAGILHQATRPDVVDYSDRPRPSRRRCCASLSVFAPSGYPCLFWISE